MERIGQIRTIVRYPVKSMAGIAMQQAVLGQYGLAGDRRFGVRRVGDRREFPWITASTLPELLLYQAAEGDEAGDELLPKRIANPAGEQHDIQGRSLCDEIGQRLGEEVEIMMLKQGIFDDSSISLIATSTVARICEQAGVSADGRRFRANMVLQLDKPVPFAEDNWVGSVVRFGNDRSGPAVRVTRRDVRCKMIGLDPDTAEYHRSVVLAAVELNENHAGVYGDVVATGVIRSGDAVFLERVI